MARPLKMCTTSQLVWSLFLNIVWTKIGRKQQSSQVCFGRINLRGANESICPRNPVRPITAAERFKLKTRKINFSRVSRYRAIWLVRSKPHCLCSRNLVHISHSRHTLLAHLFRAISVHTLAFFSSTRELQFVVYLSMLTFKKFRSIYLFGSDLY